MEFNSGFKGLRYEFGVYIYIFINMCSIGFMLYVSTSWRMHKTADYRKFCFLWGTVNDDTFSLCMFSPVNNAAEVYDRLL